MFIPWHFVLIIRSFRRRITSSNCFFVAKVEAVEIAPTIGFEIDAAKDDDSFMG